MNEVFLLILIAYFAFILLLNLVFKKRMKSLEDFFLASRNLSAFWIGLALSASWFGATSILVSTDEAYKEGVSAVWLVGVPAAATLLILAIALGTRIQGFRTLSLPDLLEARYGLIVRHLSSFLIIWYMSVLAAAQMVALGKFLELFIGAPYLASLALGTGVVLFYSILGGFRALVITNLFKFLLLVAGVAGLVFYLGRNVSLGGISTLAMGAGKGDYFRVFSHFGKNSLIALSFILAWTVSPIAWQRIQAARSPLQARRGILGAVGVLTVLYGLVVFAGMLSLPLLSGRELANPLLSELISKETNLLLGGLLFVAVLSAIMSTLDSAVNTGALSLTRDLFEQIVPGERPGRSVLASRLATLAIGGLAFLIATRFQDILKTIGLSSAIMAEGLFIPGVASVFLKKRYPLAGFLSLTLGGLFALISFLGEMEIFKLGLPVWPYSVPYGLLLSSAGFLIGLVTNKVRSKE